MQIEKLDLNLTQSVATNHCIINKINTLVDAVNEIMTWRFETDESIELIAEDLEHPVKPNTEAGELACPQKENIDLKDEVELLQKKLEKLKRFQMEIRDVLEKLPEHASLSEDACWEIMLEMEKELDND